MRARSSVLLVFIWAVVCWQSNAQTCSSQANTDYFGADLGYLLNVASSDACCSICGLLPHCQAWTFVQQSNICYVKYAIGQVRLNVNGRISGVRQFSAPTTTIAAVPTTTATYNCLVEKDANYPSNDLKLVTQVADVSACCNLCGSTPGCVSFAYAVQPQYCYLKNAALNNANRNDYVGIFSGALQGRA